MQNKRENPFSLHDALEKRHLGFLSNFPAIAGFLWKITKLSYLEKRYDETSLDVKDEEFTSHVLDELDVKYEFAKGSIKNIPKEGPVIIVCNHPFGAIEGVILLDLLCGVREDAKVMANFLLGRIPQMRSKCIFVDPFEKEGSKVRNLSPLRDSLSWLREGKLMGIFPSGTVSHFSFKSMEVVDPKWNDSVVKLVRRSGATVVPVFFEGKNSLIFQLAGLIHPILRTMLIPKELTRMSGKTVKVRIGKPIAYDKLRKISDNQKMLEFLRFRTYVLGLDSIKKDDVIYPEKKTIPHHEPIADPIDKGVLAKEVEGIASDDLLIDKGNIKVFCCKKQDIPNIMLEIGRLREISFRGVKEGTGRARDIDHFDEYYMHLFMWDKKEKTIIGAYRLGKADEIMMEYGKKGLYTHTLFSYRSSLMRQIGPALELGRSFIQPQYQKNYSTLMMLWKGIGAYVVKNPRYKILFGPVSINNEYDSISRQLIVAFLQAQNFLPQVAKLVKARNPLPAQPMKGISRESTSVLVESLDGVEELLTELETKHKTLPVLLRQYLKFGGKLLGFNVDPEFGDVLDGLIYVDLLESPRNILEKYFTKEGVQKIYSFHSNNQ